MREEFAAIRNKPKINGVDFNKADFSDFLQELINKGIQVDSMEISRGWTEVRTFDDYKKVSEMLVE